LLAAAITLAYCMVATTASAIDMPSKASPAPASRKTGSGKAAARAKSAASGNTQRKKSTTSKSRSRQRGRSAGQQAPTRERYAEIQQALILRGYMQGPATGIWGPEWVGALKRFQSDHKLEASGKLNSLTLIALGLGPKRSSPADPAAAGDDSQTVQTVPQ